MRELFSGNNSENLARTIALLFYDNFMITETLNLSNWKYK